MKMKKKNLSLLLALVFVMSLLPVTALAGNDPAGSADPDFSVFSGATELQVVLTEPEGYAPFDWMNMAPDKPVALYTVEIPEGTETVDLEFSANVLAYNYSADGTTYIAGYYEDSQKGAATATVSVDAIPYGEETSDGALDCIQVQTPYDADYNTQVLYAITFRYPLPFSATTGYTELKAVTVKQGGYTSPYGSDPVTLYTVTIPEGTATVDLSFNSKKVLAYNYSENGYISGAERYPGDAYLVGADTATVYVDAISKGEETGDGEFDFIEVQTPYAYDETAGYLTNELLFAITFDDGSTSGGGSGGGGGDTEPVTEAALLSGIASAYAENGPGSDGNAPWATADMMAYASLPNAQSKLTDAQKETVKDNAINTLFSSPTANEAAKNIVALVAMGYDPTKLTAADGTAFSAKDVLDKLAFTESGEAYNESFYEYTLPYVIMAYRLLGDAQSLQKLVALAVEIKDAWMDTTWGVDGMTPFMVALAPDYASNSDVKAALDDAVEAVKAAQLSDGCITSAFGPSAASTGLAIAGFAALGTDPHEIKNGDKNLIDGLLTFAAKDGASLGSAMDTEQGLRGLVAAAKGAGYITYTFDTSDLKPAADLSIPSVTFNIQPSNAGATLVFKDPDGNEVKPVSAGVFSRLERGDYSYTISAEGYEPSSGTVKVTAYSRETVNISLVRSASGNTPESSTAVVTVKVLTHDSAACGGKYTYRNNASAYYSILGDDESYDVTVVKGQDTARDALIATLTHYGIPFTEQANGYFSMINNETEMSHGSHDSGWLYLVNGVSATVGASEYVFNGDATMIWYFSDDYTNEYGSEAWSGGTGGSGGSTAKTDTAAEIAAAEVTVKPEVVNGEAKAEVKSEDVTKAIGQNKDAGVLEIKVDTADADKVEASLSADAVKAAADAGMGLKIETENGAVKVDGKTVDALAGSGKDVAVTVTSNSDGSTTVNVTSGGEAVGGKVKVELPAAESGKVLVVVDADGKETVVKKSVADGGKMYAELPAGSTVKVVDAEGKSFGDVKASDWFAGSVEFVTSHGLFQGTDQGFEPGTTMNRAMLVTVLYRLEDAKAAGGGGFGDVDPQAWYADAAAWGQETGIVVGTEKGFEPDEPVTREQIAAILYRYANLIGLDTGAKGNLSSFSDGGKTAGWAADAMAWAVGAGLFQGDETGALNPGVPTTRAQVAMIFERLVGLIAK